MKLEKLILLAALLGVVPGASFAQSLTRGPYLQMGSTTATTVRWRTSTATASVVKYGTSPTNLNLTLSNSVAKTEHEIRLTGLTQNTTYYYSVGNGTATYASGTDYFFITAPTAAKPTRIWVLGDSGSGTINQENVRDAYYAYTGSRHTDLWLMLGDNAYENGADADYQKTLFDIYKPMLRKSVLWSTFGNHDEYTTDSVTQTHPYFNVHTFPKNAEAGGVASNTEAYYSFDYGNIHFVCLDSTKTSRSHLGAMANWLATDLQANTKDWLIAFFHHPPYSKGSHDSDNVQNDSDMIQMREVFVPILEKYGVDLVLAGHSHSYERSRFIRNHYNFSNTYDNSYMEVQPGSGQGTGAYQKGQTGPMPKAGAVYFAAGSSGKIKGVQYVKFLTNPHPAMWASLLELGSVVIDINGQQLDAKFIDDAGAVRDSFTLFKGTGIAAPPPAPGENGIIVDNTPATSSTGSVALLPSQNDWKGATTNVGYIGSNYVHDNGSGKGTKSVKYTPILPTTGSYEVFARWAAGDNRSTNVPYTITHASGSTSAPRQDHKARGGMWNSLGIYTFNAGTGGSVTVSNEGTAANSVVIADAVSFVQQATTALPSGWTSADIGAVGVAGSATHNAGTYVVKGSGATIGGTADAFHFVSKNVTGDCIMIARVVQQGNDNGSTPNGYARAGLMIRDGTAANATFADSIITPANGHYMQSRLTTGGTVASGAGGTAAAPYWVKVQRVGNNFTGYKSVDGSNWVQVSSVKPINMPATVKFGLAVCSFNNSVLGKVTFDSVEFDPPQP